MVPNLGILVANLTNLLGLLTLLGLILEHICCSCVVSINEEYINRSKGRVEVPARLSLKVVVVKTVRGICNVVTTAMGIFPTLLA